MKKPILILMILAIAAFTGCSDDDNNSGPGNAVSFAVQSMNLTDDATPVQIVFSRPTSEAGTVTLSYQGTNASYGTDFSTDPEAEGNTVVVPFDAHATSVSFIFNKLSEAVDNEIKNVKYTIVQNSIGASMNGVNSVQLNFNEAASLGTALAPQVGGPAQSDQVFVDLSSGSMTNALRVSWDLAFYSGDDFRVFLNSTVKMSAKRLETTNIDEVQVADETMIISQGQGSANQIDEPSGTVTGTAIDAISVNDHENKVYLINMGSSPSETTPAVGTESAASGPHRGWMKVRVLRSGQDYKVQYADIASTTHQEVIIQKNSAFNHVFFSLNYDSVVNVEPQRNQWDITFTTFTNLVGPVTPYFYADFVLTNTKGGAKSYMVMNTGEVNYDTFTLAHVDDAQLNIDQRNIGANWRSTSVPGPAGPVSQFVLRTDRFFVIKDPAGNIYKLKFTGGANEAGERGYPTFQYSLVQ